MHEKIKQEEETEKYKLFLKQGVCVNINSSFILDPTFESIWKVYLSIVITKINYSYICGSTELDLQAQFSVGSHWHGSLYISCLALPGAC